MTRHDRVTPRGLHVVVLVVRSPRRSRVIGEQGPVGIAAVGFPSLLSAVAGPAGIRHACRTAQHTARGQDLRGSFRLTPSPGGNDR